MKKDIYIIKNTINDKVYIGQSINAEQRFISHCKPSSAAQNSLIDRAIQKYGKDKFYYEILESQIENYNEREKYWIAYYNSLKPNGYNINPGGENPPVFYKFDHPNKSIDNQKILDQIKKDLKETTLSLMDLAHKYNISKRTVLRINQGITYAELDESYPLRKEPNRNGKLSEDDVEQIIDILLYSYRQYEDIAKQFNVSISTIKNINSGESHKMSNIDYPIRDFKNSGTIVCTYEQVTEIINLIKTTTLSLRQIAKLYNISFNTVQIINNGSAKRYRRKNEQYPLRKF